jgi:hypothetical protein
MDTGRGNERVRCRVLAFKYLSGGDMGQQSVKLDRSVDTEVPKQHTVSVFTVHVILFSWVIITVCSGMMYRRFEG